MNPTIDHLIVAAAIAGAVVFFVIRFLRRRGKNCGGDCCGMSQTGRADKLAKKREK